MFLKSLRLRNTKSKRDSNPIELNKTQSTSDSIEEGVDSDFQRFLREARDKEQKRLKTAEKQMKQVNMNPWMRGLE